MKKINLATVKKSLSRNELRIIKGGSGGTTGPRVGSTRPCCLDRTC